VPAIAAGGAVFIAVMAILFIMAVLVIINIIQAMLRNAHVDVIPVIGGAIINAVNWLDSVVQSWNDWLWVHANPLNIVIAAVHWIGSFFVNQVASLAWDTAMTFERVIFVTIPRATATVASWAFGWSTLAWNHATALFNTAEADILRAVAGAESLAYAWSTFAWNHATDLFNTAERAMAVAVAGALAEAYAWSTYAWNHADQLYGQAQDLINYRVGELQRWAAQELNGLRSIINSDVLPKIAIVAGIATAVAVDFAKWRKDCGDPLCNNLGNFGNEIAALEGLFTDVAIFAMLAEAVHNPQGFANTVEEVFAEPLGEAFAMLTGATGVKPG
jgi:hypothetical protein